MVSMFTGARITQCINVIIAVDGQSEQFAMQMFTRCVGPSKKVKSCKMLLRASGNAILTGVEDSFPFSTKVGK